MKPEKLLPNLRLNLLCLSVIYIAIGAVLLLFPQMSLESLCSAIGIVSIIVGVVSGALYFIRRGFLNPDRYGFAAGIACVLFGLFAVLRTPEFAVAFGQVLAICMIADSIIKLQFSMDLLRLHCKIWWVALLAAAATAGLALTVLLNPFNDFAVKSIFTYSVLIADGAVNILTTALLSYSLKKHQKLTVEEPAEAETQE